MSLDITSVPELAGSNYLVDIAARIKAEHQAVAASLKRSVEHAIAAGELLLEAKERPEIEHGDWLPWLQEHCEISERTAQLYIRLAKNRDKIEEQIRNGVADLSLRQAQRFLAASSVRGSTGANNNEWYTPPEYIEAARKVLGAIDLDPATSDQAQEAVRAAKYFTKEDDGLKQEWRGLVWLNPPYSRGEIDKFVDKMVIEYKAGHIDSGIMLTHDCTDTEWWQSALRSASAICFPGKRIAFIDTVGERDSPTQGQSFFYFGPSLSKFAAVFQRIGNVVVPWHTIAVYEQACATPMLEAA
jgi:phage N-6-adenine-methyltransferase